MRIKHIAIALLLASTCLQGMAQGILRKNLDESGKTYVKGSIRTQWWARYTEANPGTLVNGQETDHIYDISMRRLRILTAAQLTPKLYVFALFGNNNLNFKNENSFVIDVLDFTVEYEFDKAFAFGIGEHAWDGLSRQTVRSSKSLLSLDAPLFSLFTVNKNDDLARNLGFWAKGIVGKLDYVVSYKQPNLYNEGVKKGVSSFAKGYPNPRIGGYAKWQFFDMESNKSAYSGGAGTLLGKKKIMNIGAGFSTQKDMMWSGNKDWKEEDGDKKNVTKHDYLTWSTEWFMDMPLAGKDALTAYIGYFDSDFGPNYYRSLGADGVNAGAPKDNKSAAGGSSYPMMGTGTTIFSQVGYLFAEPLWGETGKVQPYFAVQHSDFEGLKDKSIIFHTGFNVYFGGQANKLTFGVENRPVFMKDGTTNSRANQFVVQYQIEIN